VAAGDASFAAFPAVARKYGLAPSACQLVTIEPASKVPALLEGKADANTLGNGYLVSTGTLKSKPDLVRRFLKATMRGTNDFLPTR